MISSKSPAETHLVKRGRRRVLSASKALMGSFQQEPLLCIHHDCLRWRYAKQTSIKHVNACIAKLA